MQCSEWAELPSTGLFPDPSAILRGDLCNPQGLRSPICGPECCESAALRVDSGAGGPRYNFTAPPSLTD